LGDFAIKVGSGSLAEDNFEGVGLRLRYTTIEEIRQHEECHPVGSRARLALALFLYTGQRRSDVVRFGRQHIRNGRLVFTQEKNKKHNPVRLEIPILPELQRILDASRSPPQVLGTRCGTGASQAKLPHCSAHGLRKAAAPRLAEHGATPSGRSWP
jgi:integrase